ncbi:hypothetical protein DdX_17154 [Ditylenchus destructor]|uniref:Uncharacterized protein n=1 Tax=Ditylenchus destructor TaxID=166010 RepID=A0AAD4MNM1_9BILA|nr:hypothetical protein DdX_17154 [Ditylenchus destructor]
MDSFRPVTAAIKVFNKELSTEAYNEWVICNNYSEQVPLQDQVTTMQSPQNSGYRLSVFAHYKDQTHHELLDRTTVFHAVVELNREYWPAFQHFVRLIADPFVYIDTMELTYQNDVLNLLSGAINSERRLQCKKFDFNLNGNSQKSITWTKNHVRCNQFYIYGESDLNLDEALLDFFVTGARCTPSLKIGYHDLPKAVVDFVQKFMELKNSDESQLVEAIEGNFKSQVVELLKRDYAEFIVKEERGHRYNTHIFEFVNVNIGKKLRLIAKNYIHVWSLVSIKINDL